MTQIVYAIWTSFTIPGKNFYTHTKCESYSCMSDIPPTYLYINVIAITWNHNTLLMPGLVEYFEWVSSWYKYDSDHKQVLACENVKMWKCENVINDYKWLRILKKFLRSYVYKWRGTLMLCPKSPHRLRRRCQYLSAVAVNICRLSLSIYVGCHCQNLTLSPLSIFATDIIVTSCSRSSQCNYCKYCKYCNYCNYYNYCKQNDMWYAICDMAVTAVKLL